MGPEFISTAEVSKRYDVTLRQLQWWDEQGVVCPKIDGGDRMYSPSDVALVAFIVRLIRCGFSFQKTRNLAVQFRRRAQSAAFAIVQGESIAWCDTPSSAFEIIQNASLPSVLFQLQ